MRGEIMGILDKLVGKADVETKGVITPKGEDNFTVTPVGVATEPVNHVQQEDNYELPSIAPAPAEVPAPVVEAPAKTDLIVGIEEHKTNHLPSTTGQNLDYAIDLFMVTQKHDFLAAKAVLFNRLGLLEAEADAFVGDKIHKVRAMFE